MRCSNLKTIFRAMGVVGAMSLSTLAVADPFYYNSMVKLNIYCCHAHETASQSDLRVMKVPHSAPAGESMELWVLASQRWTDRTKSRVRMCAYPRIEVTGRLDWSTPFGVRLDGARSPGGRSQTLATVDVVPPLAVGISRELASSADWCVERNPAGRKQPLVVVTPYGSVKVDFAAPPPR